MTLKAPLQGARSELAPAHPLFPRDLSELAEPVKRLYTIGRVGLLTMPSLAIVGARKASPYGLSCAYRFGKRAAEAGIAVVSGGAIGCDQAAHRGALEAGGQAIVVLGCGADVVYPARARLLFEEALAAGGVIASEAPWGSPPAKWAFRKRNRVIAALAKATLIVEAGLPSGTFSTADYTLSQGKDVLVVPGSIDSPDARGSNRLLLQGATPVIDIESFDDALNSVLGWPVAGDAARGMACHETQALEGAGTGLSEEEFLVLKACTSHPMRVEELAGIAAVDVMHVIRVLSSLELMRKVTRMRDGRYAAISPNLPL